MVKMKKVATYAIASAMIACAGISTGNIGVQAATKTPVTKAKVSFPTALRFIVRSGKLRVCILCSLILQTPPCLV